MSNAIVTSYRDTHGDAAATTFCRDLMKGDPKTFKAGYSAENAVLATVDMFGLSEAQKAALTAEVTPKIHPREYAFNLLVDHLESHPDVDEVTISGKGGDSGLQYALVSGVWGSSDAPTHVECFSSRDKARSAAEQALIEREPLYPIALFDLDEIGPEPEPEYGDFVKYEGETYCITSHDYEGMEGEAVLKFSLSEDAAGGLDTDIEVDASEVTLVRRGEDYRDTRVPARFDLAGWTVHVLFNSVSTVRQVA